MNGIRDVILTRGTTTHIWSSAVAGAAETSGETTWAGRSLAGAPTGTAVDMEARRFSA
jgi:hypothetical protein